MSLIPKCKIGDCSCGCGGKDVEVVKVGKLLYCLSSYRAMKTKQYASKATVKQKVRSLGNKQVSEGNYFDAERQALVNDLDYCFSRIVRISAADVHGYCECFTCGAKKHWTLQQCGHFVKRANTLVRFDFRNARVQDKYCNENLGGNLEVFAQKLNEEQSGLAEQLIEISREPHKWGREELKQLLIDLRAKLRIVEAKLKLTNT
jgi:hypothetical protein